MQVSAFIVGAPRCGTYAWFNYLGQHPQVIASRRKEPNWFCTDLPGVWGVRSLEEYHGLFTADPSLRRHLAIEASVLYLASKAAPEQIQRYNPRARILIFLRSPLDFLRSYHGLLRWLLFEDRRDFASAWALQQARADGGAIPTHCLEPATLQYAAMAKFGEQLARYLQYFPSDQIRVLTHDAWIAAPRTAYLQVLDFLGLDDDGRQEFPVVNAALAYRSDRLAALLRYPPGWLRRLTSLWQKLPGNRRLALHQRLLRWNTRPAGRLPIPAELASQVTLELAEDDALLQRLLPAVRIGSHGTLVDGDPGPRSITESSP